MHTPLSFTVRRHGRGVKVSSPSSRPTRYLRTASVVLGQTTSGRTPVAIKILSRESDDFGCQASAGTRLFTYFGRDDWRCRCGFCTDLSSSRWDHTAGEVMPGPVLAQHIRSPRRCFTVYVAKSLVATWCCESCRGDAVLGVGGISDRPQEKCCCLPPFLNRYFDKPSLLAVRRKA